MEMKEFKGTINSLARESKLDIFWLAACASPPSFIADFKEAAKGIAIGIDRAGMLNCLEVLDPKTPGDKKKASAYHMTPTYYLIMKEFAGENIVSPELRKTMDELVSRYMSVDRNKLDQEIRELKAKVESDRKLDELFSFVQTAKDIVKNAAGKGVPTIIARPSGKKPATGKVKISNRV